MGGGGGKEEFPIRLEEDNCLALKKGSEMFLTLTQCEAFITFNYTYMLYLARETF